MKKSTQLTAIAAAALVAGAALYAAPAIAHSSGPGYGGSSTNAQQDADCDHSGTSKPASADQAGQQAGKGSKGKGKGTKGQGRGQHAPASAPSA
ncbi:MAG: hypothetical protein RL068_577 [Actinomycetota bacterium]|jgi:hypothetical protein